MKEEFARQRDMAVTLLNMVVELNALNALLPVDEQQEWDIRVDKYSIDVYAFRSYTIRDEDETFVFKRMIWIDRDNPSEKYSKAVLDLTEATIKTKEKLHALGKDSGN